MPLQFMGTKIRFTESLQLVVIAAQRQGVPINVLVPPPVLEHFTSKKKLSKDEAFTAVARNKARLEEAADRAFLRQATHSATVMIAVDDITFDAPLVASESAKQPGQSRGA